MHFITEAELRNQYEVKSFASYELKSDERLTPSAVQFLNDRKIVYDNKVLKRDPLIREALTKEICCSTAAVCKNESVRKEVCSGTPDISFAAHSCRAILEMAQTQRGFSWKEISERYAVVYAVMVQMGLIVGTGKEAESYIASHSARISGFSDSVIFVWTGCFLEEMIRTLERAAGWDRTEDLQKVLSMLNLIHMMMQG